MRIILILLGLLMYSFPVSAQIGNRQRFAFLNMPVNTRVAALGGVNITADAKDASLWLSNPALVDEDNNKRLAMNYFNYYAGISYTTLAYNWHSSKWGKWGAGLQYLSYGQFDGYDANGNATGSFSARDYAFVISHSRKIDHFSLGINMKVVSSAIASWRASGLLFDVGGAFLHPKKDFRVGLTVKNVGFAFSNYTDASRFSMPFDAQLGVSFKPEKMPVRFSLTAHHLYRFDIAYNDPAKKGELDAEGNEIKTKISFADKLARHFVPAVELVFHKNFNLRMGYNFLQRRELAVETKKGLAGFSFGGMVRVKALEFSFSRSVQHLAGVSNSFGLVVNTKSLFLRKKTVN